MNLKSQLESLLLVAAKPLSLKELNLLLSVEAKEIETSLRELADEYERGDRGIRVISQADKYQLASAPDSAEVIKKFLQNETAGELSQPSLEALTIIAYRGPISKFDLERIRGVNCSLIVRNLMLRGLIEEKFEKNRNENLYSASLEFVKFLGLSRLEDLPDYESLKNNPALSEFLAIEEEGR
ncbi:MAG: SMC-Scp complex subunit ScpB [Patescibacteria group bacterium]